MRTLFIALSLSFTLLLSAQDAKEILGKSVRAINNLETVSYHVEILQTNLLSDDTSRYVADCLLKRMPQDTIAKMYYYFSTGNTGFYKYNGSAFYSYAPDYYNFVFRYSVKDHPEKFRAVAMPNGVSPPEVTSVFYYINSLLKSVEEVSSMLDEIAAGKSKSGSILSVIGDTLVDEVKCYGFRMTKPKKNFTSHKLILIDQDNLLPVAVIKDFKGSGLSLSKESIALGQFFSVKYSKIRESVPRFDYLMSDKSLPKKAEVTDHLPFAEPFKIGDHAPAFLLPEVNTGKFLSSDSLAGRIVVLDFTSTWCIHCAEGAAVIREMQQKYSDRKDVIFINVFSSSTDTREKIQKYASKHSFAGISLYNAAGIEKTWGIHGYPDFFLLDRHGRIAYFQRGYSTDLQRNLVRQTEDCLGKK